jgi:hypothetical protein
MTAVRVLCFALLAASSMHKPMFLSDGLTMMLGSFCSSNNACFVLCIASQALAAGNESLMIRGTQLLNNLMQPNTAAAAAAAAAAAKELAQHLLQLLGPAVLHCLLQLQHDPAAGAHLRLPGITPFVQQLRLSEQFLQLLGLLESHGE